MCKRFTKFILIVFVVLINRTVMFSQNFWERTNIPPRITYTMAVTSNGDIWAVTGGYPSGESTLRLSTDNGNTWLQKFIFQSVATMAISPVNGYIFVGLYTNELFMSTDRGDNWAKILDNTTEIHNILITPSGDIYIGTRNNLYYSNDNGDTWIVKNNELPDGMPPVYSLALEKDGTLYAGTANMVYRSIDGGDTWLPSSNYTNIYPNVNVVGLAISDDGSIFATTDCFGIEHAVGILKSTDKGVVWFQVNNGRAVKNARKIIYNPITRDIFIGDAEYSSGVYRSTNLGASWELINTGISDRTYTHEFAFNPNTGQMYVVTGDGIYRSKNQTILVEEPIDVTSDGSTTLLFQSSPNPVRSGYDAFIRYRINTAGQTSLILYDILGREVAKLVNEYKSAGVYSVNFNTRNLSSGVYFYKLTAAGYEGTKKMLIIR
jgi:photosystem II stability/assembly factor-like uncharacterized protein